MKKRTRRYSLLGYLCLLFTSGILIAVAAAYAYMALFLPSVSVLEEARLQVPLRIYTADGQLISEYGDKRRIPITYDDIPPELINAVLDTEDKRFFEHSGVDFLGLGRAGLIYLTTGRRAQGGSTITMQVARNFFLTRKKTFYRKFKEILLAIKIDQKFSKQKILTLYFNKIFLGKHAYGFAAAAQVYYGKPLNQLSLAQYAMLAGLPKAPSSGNPIANPDYALKRRNHVLSRMLDSQHITKQDYFSAISEPVTASYHQLKATIPAPYVAELIGNYLYKQYGADTYSLGLQITTTIDSHDQLAANNAVKEALFAYDKRHGYRPPTENLGEFSAAEFDHWKEKLANYADKQGLQAAAVVELFDQSANVMLASGQLITLHWDQIAWAKPARESGWPGPPPKTARDIFQVGDIIRIRPINNTEWALDQLPEVEGALVAISPNDGAVQALVGGLDFNRSKFNRATQAKRQVGSSIKPFIYAAALNHGMSLATLVNDAPIVIKDSGENILWRPQNDTRQFYGPTRLRTGLVKSRNIVSIRILQAMGLPYATDYLTHFGFEKTALPQALSLALGTPEFTPMQMAKAYSVFANGGFRIAPYLINTVKASNGKIIFQASPKPICQEAILDDPNPTDKNGTLCAPRVIDPQVNYLMNLALKDVIQSGTGRAARVLHRKDLAGKTGTTDDQNDAWFAGFNPDLVTIAWVGFDTPESLHEYGSKAALPMWINFMKPALKGVPNRTLAEPTGIVTARINPKNGLVVSPNQTPFVYEKFRTDHVPKRDNTQVTVKTSKQQTTTTDSASIGDLY